MKDAETLCLSQVTSFNNYALFFVSRIINLVKCFVVFHSSECPGLGSIEPWYLFGLKFFTVTSSTTDTNTDRNTLCGSIVYAFLEFIIKCKLWLYLMLQNENNLQLFASAPTLFIKIFQKNGSRTTRLKLEMFVHLLFRCAAVKSRHDDSAHHRVGFPERGEQMMSHLDELHLWKKWSSSVSELQFKVAGLL